MSPWWKAAWVAYAALIIAIVVICGTIAGCAPVVVEGPFVSDTPIEWSNQSDQAGNTYPVACMGHIEEGLDVDIQPVSHAALQRLLPPETPVNIQLRGRWTGPARGTDNKDGAILIDRELPPGLYADALRHELCHAKMFKLTGSAAWHP